MIRLEGVQGGNTYLFNQDEVAAVTITPERMVIFMKGDRVAPFEIMGEDMDLNRAANVVAKAMEQDKVNFIMKRMKGPNG